VADYVGYIAGVHAIAVTENFIAYEWHQQEMPQYKDISDAWPLVKSRYIDVPMQPGIGVKVHEKAIRPLCRRGDDLSRPRIPGRQGEE